VRTAFLVAAALLLSVNSASAQLVQRVIDGDTVAIQGIGTVRLIGVDAPEADQQSAGFLRQLIINKVVRLEYDRDRTDRYDRVLAYLYLSDGAFVNAEIVKQGYAAAYTAFPFRFMEQFRAYEREARAAKRGMWANGQTVAAAAMGAVNAQTIVYVTKTGEKYHRAGCRSLARSQIPMPLEQAAARYGACGVCRPPTLQAGPSPAKAAPAPSPSPSPSVGSDRCQAITQKGTQCSRRAQAGSNYCWQHSR
jgi:micrococcal nuclease